MPRTPHAVDDTVLTLGEAAPTFEFFPIAPLPPPDPLAPIFASRGVERGWGGPVGLCKTQRLVDMAVAVAVGYKSPSRLRWQCLCFPFPCVTWSPPAANGLLLKRPLAKLRRNPGHKSLGEPESVTGPAKVVHVTQPTPLRDIQGCDEGGTRSAMSSGLPLQKWRRNAAHVCISN